MRRCVVLTFIGFLSCATVAQCAEADDLIKSQIALLNQLADASEKKSPADKLKEITDKLALNGGKLDKLGLKKDEQVKLFKQYEAEFQKALFRASESVPDSGTGSPLPEIGGLFGVPATSEGWAEIHLKHMLAQSNELSAGIEKGDPKDKLKPIARRMQASQDRLGSVRLTETAKTKLKDQYKVDMDKAMTRLFAAVIKAGEKGMDLADLFGK